MIAADGLRLPGPLDPAPWAYRDWLHLNLFDLEGDRVGLVNASLHGAPDGPASQVVTAALVDVGGEVWEGDVVPGGWRDASVTLNGVATAVGGVALVDDEVLAAARLPRLVVDVHARPRTPAASVEVPQPFGSGWIAWRVVPALTAVGRVGTGPAAGTEDPDGGAAGRWAAYHDHNWGRWHWGDDVGWEWGSFLGGGGASVVVARTTDRAHERGGPWTVIVDHEGTRRAFTGARVAVEWSGRAPSPTRRLPGALAAQHPDRARPSLPGAVRIVARAGRDRVEVDFSCRAVAQLILADPVVAGRSFLHEMSGRFVVRGAIGGHDLADEGLAIVERLE